MIPDRLCDNCGGSGYGTKIGQKCNLSCGGTFQRLDKSRSRRRSLGKVTVEFFVAVFGDAFWWVFGLIGVLALVGLWGLLLR